MVPAEPESLLRINLLLSCRDEKPTRWGHRGWLSVLPLRQLQCPTRLQLVYLPNLLMLSRPVAPSHLPGSVSPVPSALTWSVTLQQTYFQSINLVME